MLRELSIASPPFLSHYMHTVAAIGRTIHSSFFRHSGKNARG